MGLLYLLFDKSEMTVLAKKKKNVKIEISVVPYYKFASPMWFSSSCHLLLQPGDDFLNSGLNQ